MPCGKYHFNVVPQGLNGSPDQFNVKSDHVIDSEEQTEKLMDDNLGQSRTCQEAYDQCSKIFCRMMEMG